MWGEFPPTVGHFPLHWEYYFIHFSSSYSAALDVRGDLTIDGVAVETGVRVSLNIHTSTGTDFTLRLLDGQGVDVKVGLPVKKQEIISLKTDIVSIVKEDGKPEATKPVSFDVKR